MSIINTLPSGGKIKGTATPQDVVSGVTFNSSNHKNENGSLYAENLFFKVEGEFKDSGVKSDQSMSDRGFKKICYGNGVYVAVDNLSTNAYPMVYMSYNGIQWQVYQFEPIGVVIKDVCFGNGIFVAIGNYNKSAFVFTSSDGVTWKSENLETVPLPMVSITHDEASRKFITFGYDKQHESGVMTYEIMITTNGSDLEEIHSSGSQTSGEYVDSCSMGNLTLGLISNSDTHQYQVIDAVNKQVKGGKIDLSQSFSNVIGGNGVFVAISETNNIYVGEVRFSNSVFWKKSKALPLGEEGIRSLSFGNGLFMFVNGSNSIYRSLDGFNWDKIEIPKVGKKNQSIDYANGQFIVMEKYPKTIYTMKTSLSIREHYNNKVKERFSLENWKMSNVDMDSIVNQKINPASLEFYCSCYFHDRFLLIGNGNTQTDKKVCVCLQSENGDDWKANQYFPLNGMILDATVGIDTNGEKRIVIVGDKNNIYSGTFSGNPHSPIIWEKHTPQNGAASDKYLAVCFDKKNNRYVAVGDNGIIAVSTNDAKSWLKIKKPEFSSHRLLSVAASPSGSILIGTSTNKILFCRSTHPTEFATMVMNKLSSTDTIRDVCWNGSEFLCRTAAGSFTVGGDNFSYHGNLVLFRSPSIEKMLYHENGKKYVAISSGYGDEDDLLVIGSPNINSWRKGNFVNYSSNKYIDWCDACFNSTGDILVAIGYSNGETHIAVTKKHYEII